MFYVYDKKLVDIWQSKAMDLGMFVGEFEVDGIKFESIEDQETVGDVVWETHTVWADGVKIYYKEETA